MESYLKFTFSRDILIFAITWMGTRDIYIALFITLTFMLISDVLMNEKSPFCCLPRAFIDKHVALLEGFNSKPSKDEIEKFKILMKEVIKENEEKI